ncbi:diguanylate cyclase [Novimethylophilus kurashikiensis]|uniref:Diguanylate cyclase n=1 Tax=Novimethylophilus kurashikiensis TaxID=1825523 RepID=A0A2R5F9S7_9PROT|nr:hypothetical protein [Novimethylophilus kurashikiensis]GBG14298.1 diguanylate cyclase [Novimethylophilus kurashikiensis]
MARTVRRKHYTPAWVTEDSYYFIDPVFNVECYGGHIELDGDERANKLRWWHEDKSCWWGERPPKPYRQCIEVQHRMTAKTELCRWKKNPEHEVQLLRKGLLGYWN